VPQIIARALNESRHPADAYRFQLNTDYRSATTQPSRKTACTLSSAWRRKSTTTISTHTDNHLRFCDDQPLSPKLAPVLPAYIQGQRVADEPVIKSLRRWRVGHPPQPRQPAGLRTRKPHLRWNSRHKTETPAMINSPSRYTPSLKNYNLPLPFTNARAATLGQRSLERPPVKRTGWPKAGDIPTRSAAIFYMSETPQATGTTCGVISLHQRRQTTAVLEVRPPATSKTPMGFTQVYRNSSPPTPWMYLSAPRSNRKPK